MGGIRAVREKSPFSRLSDEENTTAYFVYRELGDRETTTPGSGCLEERNVRRTGFESGSKKTSNEVDYPDHVGLPGDHYSNDGEVRDPDTRRELPENTDSLGGRDGRRRRRPVAGTV